MEEKKGKKHIKISRKIEKILNILEKNFKISKIKFLSIYSKNLTPDTKIHTSNLKKLIFKHPKFHKYTLLYMYNYKIIFSNLHLHIRIFCWFLNLFGQKFDLVS